MPRRRRQRDRDRSREVFVTSQGVPRDAGHLVDDSAMRSTAAQRRAARVSLHGKALLLQERKRQTDDMAGLRIRSAAVVASSRMAATWSASRALTRSSRMPAARRMAMSRPPDRAV